MVHRYDRDGWGAFTHSSNQPLPDSRPSMVAVELSGGSPVAENASYKEVDIRICRHYSKTM